MYSKRPAQWVLRKLGTNESYVAPQDIHRVAMERGMTGVTITDHNTIEGCLAIADLPGTFISEEVTTYFPEDKCKVHVVAYDISEAQHREIERARENIFDLVPYLEGEEIVFSLAHPLFKVNDRLTTDHIEKLLLMFRMLELNGDQNEEENVIVRQFATLLKEKDMMRMADKHGMEPYHSEPWKKCLVCGSDDHSLLYAATSYTEADAEDIEGFFNELLTGQTSTVCRSSTPHTMAHKLYSIAYQHYRKRFSPGDGGAKVEHLARRRKR